MKIGIVGGGAIGLLFAAYLGKNHEVTIYCRTKNQADSINLHHITLLKNEISEQIRVTSVSSSQYLYEDLFIFTVKQYHLPEMISFIQQSPENIPLLFVQNGMGHLSYLESLPHKNIWVGTVEHGAMKLNDYTVKHTGIGEIKLAVFRGKEETLQKFLPHLQTDYFPFIIHPNYQEMLYQKLAINVSINPLTTVLKAKNGELIENPYYFKLLKSVMNEICNVLEFSNRDEIIEQVMKVCNNTGENVSSMLKDVQENRKTEIDAIVGYLLHVANQKRKDTPVLQFLYHAVKGMEKSGGNNVD